MSKEGSRGETVGVEGEVVRKAGIDKCDRVADNDVEEVGRSEAGEGVESIVVR